MIEAQPQLVEALKDALAEAADLRRQVVHLARELAKAHEELARRLDRDYTEERIFVCFDHEITDDDDRRPSDSVAAALGPFRYVTMESAFSTFPRLIDDDDQILAEYEAAGARWTSPQLPGRSFQSVSADARPLWLNSRETA